MSQTNRKYNRLEALLSGARPVQPDPGIASANQEVEELKAQVAELEAQLVGRGSTLIQSESAPALKTDTQPHPAKPAEAADRMGAGKPSNVEDGQKRIGLWVAGIFAAISLALLVFSYYMVYIVGPGQPDLSDKTLELVAGLMFIASLISFYLIRRNRFVLGTWILFSIVIVPPIPAVLVLKDIITAIVVYIAILASILITWVLPITSRRHAIIAAGVSFLAIVGIQVWNPAFRLGSSTFPNFTIYIIIAAALAIMAFFIRQAALGKIRTKLITAFVVMAVLSMGTVAFLADRSLRSNLTTDIINSQGFFAASQGFQVGQAINSQFDKLKSLATIKSVQVGTETAGQEERPTDVSEIERLNLAWRAIVAAKNTADPLVVELLYNPLSTQLRNFQRTFPENLEILLTDAKGFSIAATSTPTSYYQADSLWWRTAHTNGRYIGQPLLDPATNSIAIDMAVPVYSYINGEFVGVLRATINFNVLTDLLIQGFHGQTGYSVIYQPNDQEIKLRSLGDGNYEIVQTFASSDLQKFIKSSDASMEFSLEGIPVLASSAEVRSYSSFLAREETSPSDDLGWNVIAVQEISEALAPVEVQTRNNLILVIVVSIIVIAVAYFLAQLITNPIVRLNDAALQVASGDLATQAKVETTDEIGTLAGTFNNMTSQLRSLFGSLEQRVLDRTHDLELASEVGRTITQKIADFNEMLTTSVELIRARFDLYYTQVYLTDPAGDTLVLRAGTGEVGKELLKRRHHLDINSESVNGQAVLGRKPVIVSDTLESASFKPNPMLPETRSEIAIPLLVGDRVLGVLDMQSEQAGSLNETNLPAFEALAGQLAVAVQNASLFAQAEEARADVDAQIRGLTERGWKEFMNAIDRGLRVGYVYDQAEVSPLKEKDLVPLPAERAISIPIRVAGAKVGIIQAVDRSDRDLSADEKELLQAAANQLAGHIENLRLLAQAEGYRTEAEQALRHLTREGWDQLQLRTAQVPGYVFDLNEVKPLSGNGTDSLNTAFTQPLMVRDETIGELAAEVGTKSEQAAEIITAVAEQLSTHIETLRLADELQKRAAELQELDRLKTAFLANMSHELRTPLNSILGFADVLLEELDGPLTENMNNDIQLIHKNGNHLLHLINDVLDMAKIEAGRMNLSPTQFKVHDIFEDVFNISSPQANDKGISLIIEDESDQQVEIIADRTRISQVLLNVVNNAIKFTDLGSVNLSVRREGENALIAIRDTGDGIPADKLESIFQEFTQVDSSTTRKVGGTGLGLPISRRLIEMHGGRLWAESTGTGSGQGSVFFVELPLESKITESIEAHER
jgi:signal transduction histidine kinase/HAMP domain-containing protein